MMARSGVRRLRLKRIGTQVTSWPHTPPGIATEAPRQRVALLSGATDGLAAHDAAFRCDSMWDVINRTLMKMLYSVSVILYI